MSKNKRHCPLCGSPSDAWAETVAKPKAPWEQAGVSRRTYYRRLKAGASFDARRDKMAELLDSGEAKTLEEAYDKAKERG
jgi:hypothetical protein